MNAKNEKTILFLISPRRKNHNWLDLREKVAELGAQVPFVAEQKSFVTKKPDGEEIELEEGKAECENEGIEELEEKKKKRGKWGISGKADVEPVHQETEFWHRLCCCASAGYEILSELEHHQDGTNPPWVNSGNVNSQAVATRVRIFRPSKAVPKMGLILRVLRRAGHANAI
ncbi:hypothetical protein GPALN_004503 [Globodera pallida]|nr:hypothetical protein GPALN_004503 [Globodera pallida]